MRRDCGEDEEKEDLLWVRMLTPYSFQTNVEIRWSSHSSAVRRRLNEFTTPSLHLLLSFLALGRRIELTTASFLVLVRFQLLLRLSTVDEPLPMEFVPTFESKARTSFLLLMRPAQAHQ
jgi:hypothetical protein